MFVFKFLTLLFAIIVIVAGYGSTYNNLFGKYGTGYGQYMASDGRLYSCNCYTDIYDGTGKSCWSFCQKRYGISSESDEG
uniref:Uncharacterized protein n=1 Tax=Acrobeloides nanus TaxID=290746 RepID=A0A914DZ14_9BILA